MKWIMILGASLFYFGFAHAQGTENLTLKTVGPKEKTTNIYYYQPPEHLSIPGKIHASVVYKKNGQEREYCETVPLFKAGKGYQFYYKAEDSVQALVISIDDEHGTPIDNNNDQGFIVCLADGKGRVPASAYLEAEYLLSDYAPRVLKLDQEKMDGQEIHLFEKAYRLSPSLKNESSYAYYLYLLYKANKDSMKPALLAYAHQMASAGSNEAKWLNALYVYRRLRMDREYAEVENKAISIYPNGKIAQQKFLDNLGSDSTEAMILDKMAEYIHRFKDTSAQMNYAFYYSMISLLLGKNEYGKLTSYEALMDDRYYLAHMYDFVAHGLANGHIDGKDTSLVIARMLSGKTLDFTRERMARSAVNRNDGIVQDAYNNYADTYAQILYKSGDYDSAFYYQSTIDTSYGRVAPGILEHYAVYAEKVKGDAFAYQFLMKQLGGGVRSLVMLQQLKSICAQMGIPDTAYDAVREKSIKLARVQSTEKIRQEFGSVKGKMFSLKNLKGDTVSIAQFKNKIIVLDFWATWCAYCRASFPGMQETINKYKNDTGVVFLFVDTWEQIHARDKRPQKIKEDVTRFLKDHNYTFDVLLDDKNEAVDKYKVAGIPATFILDGKGNIVFAGEPSDLSLEIENARD